ncbi:alkaline phosphatase family protein [Halopelagius longus]|uniref:Sulfatase n=1 Tax=Halopelagius longus TaxID=1236180 RepID=A0A1H1GKS0_9EURY|nr:hypothetical protein [Halopelagius longus]RDI69696.1 hypothetical protein DWB78_18165 [Halopelagius longus]SDR13488.1 hypothetical protein SAMN05216278_3721 [Halopelagius longus]
MDFKWWVSETVSRTQDEGIPGVLWGAERGYHKLLQFSSTLRPPGTPIWSLEWDLLLVVDACRFDLMRAVADEYDFIDSVDSTRSVNSVTRLWMEENFDEKYANQLHRTTYITGNPWSKEKVNDEAFDDVDHVWEDAWVEPGTVPPEPITDEVIRRGRDDSPDRMIAHYMQPHAPFIPEPDMGPGKQLDGFREQTEGDLWEALQRGELTEGEVWKGYLDNLRHVLDDIERLLKNVDAERVVITSDHGNGFGEWGIYGHPPDMPLNSLRTVPVVRTSAEDTGESVPSEERVSHDVSRNEQLEALGYV